MYDIFMDGEKIGMGMSQGEVNQWLIDTIDELNAEDQKVFKEDFGFTEGSIGFAQGDFADFLYGNKHSYPLQLRFGKEFMVIDNSSYL